MGLLDQVIGNVINSRMGGQQGGMGGGLGGMLGGALGGGGLGGGGMGGMGGGSSPLVMALMALLGSGALGGGGGGLGGLLGGMTGGGIAGGLGGLLERFQQNGHGSIADSWVGDGENQPIAPHQLNQALGQDTVDQLSQQTGLPQGDLLQQLSQVLPDVVHGVTPNGRLPTEAEASQW
ncbi:YidB family protein [Aureimonas leprariae]|uniref:DUF937 domain-containing protein n=1 Tax=Plantimonas leprariae TaxID=2615207 RepID=A0A7V7PKF8_9HYPH|nr:YidB family protein [Aureimonas leprariae]KAB0676181.1 DUF937 domain-containing protein [Aureimonas leprariae]